MINLELPKLNWKITSSSILGILKYFSFARQINETILKPIKLSRSINYNYVKLFNPGHFYSPLPDIPTIICHKEKIFNKQINKLPSIDINENSQIKTLEEFSSFYDSLPFTELSHRKKRYYFDNGYFDYGDSIILYSIMRQFKPSRVIEVGSGFSSAAMLDTNDAYFNNEIEFTFIEPYPEERLLRLLSEEDANNCNIIIDHIQNVDISIFKKLEQNDILFIDSSHVGKIGSDVLHILSNVVPTLKKGVLIHFHDIFWPFEYPEIWLKVGRAWNEAYFLKAFLQYNDTFEIVFFNSFMATHHHDLLIEKMPLILKKSSADLSFSNSSLWLRKLN